MFKIFERGQNFFEHIQIFSTHPKFFEHVQKFLDGADGQGISFVKHQYKMGGHGPHLMTTMPIFQKH